MIAGWAEAPTNASVAASIGLPGFQRRPITEPAIVPTPNDDVMIAHAPAPPSSRSASTAPSASTHGSATRW
jgi:hypothetical protein